jgi:hypothetical protein
MARPKNFKQALIATMIPIFTHTNSALVGLAKSMLEDAGVGAVLKNEFSSVGFPPYNLQQELWLLDDKDLEAAQEILANLNDSQGQQDESET